MFKPLLALLMLMPVSLAAQEMVLVRGAPTISNGDVIQRYEPMRGKLNGMEEYITQLGVGTAYRRDLADEQQEGVEPSVDLTANYSFDPPPAVIVPGTTIEMNMTVTLSGGSQYGHLGYGLSVNSSGNYGSRFVDGVLAASAADLPVFDNALNRHKGTFTRSIMAQLYVSPNAGSGFFIQVFFDGNTTGTHIVWEYTLQEKAAESGGWLGPAPTSPNGECELDTEMSLADFQRALDGLSNQESELLIRIHQVQQNIDDPTIILLGQAGSNAVLAMPQDQVRDELGTLIERLRTLGLDQAYLDTLSGMKWVLAQAALSSDIPRDALVARLLQRRAQFLPVERERLAVLEEELTQTRDQFAQTLARRDVLSRFLDTGEVTCP